MNENDVLPIFQQFGTVCEVHVLRDRVTGVSRGCAFVVMAVKEEADAAIAELDKQRVLPPVLQFYSIMLTCPVNKPDASEVCRHRSRSLLYVEEWRGDNH